MAGQLESSTEREELGASSGTHDVARSTRSFIDMFRQRRKEREEAGGPTRANDIKSDRTIDRLRKCCQAGDLVAVVPPLESCERNAV